MKRRRVLVLAAHCDDAELGAGGLLRESKRAAVWIACSTDGQRREESLAAGAVLGYDLYFGGLEDRELWERDAQMVVQIEAAVEAFGPAVVAIPPAEDTHPDHRAVRAAALSALRRSPVSIIEYESPSAPIGWAPDYFVPVSEEGVDAVELALGLYVSQSKASYLQEGAYRARVRAAGVRVGTRHAEPYKAVRITAPAH